jgi:hypothetical protein
MADNVVNQQPDIERVRDLLSPYLDGEVTEAERALVEQALAASPELRDELESLRRTVDLVASLPPMPAPRPFTLTEADVKAPAPARKKYFGFPAWAGGLAMLATALVCVLAAGGLFFSRSQLGGGAPAAEIAYQAEEAAPAEMAMEEAPAEEDDAAAEVEQEVIETVEVEKEVGQAVMATPEPAAKEEALASEAPAGAAPADEMADMAEAEEAQVEEAAPDAPVIAGEADDANRGRDTEGLVGAPPTPTATPSPLPTPTPAIALSAPATELAEEKAGAAESGAEQPAAEEAAPPPAEPQLEETLEANQASPPTATIISSPTPTALALLTVIPTDTPVQKVMGEPQPVAEEGPSVVPYRAILAGLIVLGMLVFLIGLIAWLIKRSRR